MNLYTFVLEYRGGTYVSQYESHTLQGACRLWRLDQRKEKLRRAFEEDSYPIAIEADPKYGPGDIVNAWCDSALVGKKQKLALITIVLTKK